MEKRKTSLAYILTFEDVLVIGGRKEYHLADTCYSIIGMKYKDSIIDIKTKKIYPLLQIDENQNICNDISFPTFACIDESFLKELGLKTSLEISDEDEKLLQNEIQDTLHYIQTLEEKDKKIISYDKFKIKRMNYKRK